MHCRRIHSDCSSDDADTLSSHSSSTGRAPCLDATALDLDLDRITSSPTTATTATAAIVTIKPNIKLMSNSERGKYYRRKRKLYAADLGATVAKLRLQVRALAARQCLRDELALSTKHTPVGSLAKLVREYFAQFEFGTPVHETPSGLAGPTTRVATASPQQLSFLHAAMEPHVGFGDFVGTALIVDQWQRYSMYHGGIWFELTSLDVVTAAQGRAPISDDGADDDDPAMPVIAVRANLHVRITRETIEHVFPHLADQDNALVHALLGLDIAYPCVNHFYFARGGTIARYDPYVDFVSALMSKIQSLAGVTHVLEHARIAKDHMIGAMDASDDAPPPPRVAVASPSPSTSSSSGMSDDEVPRGHVAPRKLAIDFILS